MKIALRTASVLAALTAAAGLTSLPASAATCTSGDVTFALIEASDASCSTGQPDYSGPEPIIETFFDMEYTLSFKSDEAGKGTGAITFTDPPTKGEAAPATWAISDPSGIASHVIIGFKQAGHYGAFLLSSLSGEWQINGPSSSLNDYSHVDIWYKPDGTAIIPLPASLTLLLGGLGGLGFIGWRRRSG